MNGFKIFKQINNLLFSPIYTNSLIYANKKNIPIGILSDENNFRITEEKFKITTGIIGWHCFKTNNDAITYLKEFIWFQLDFKSYVIYACDIENLYIERKYDFNTNGFTCQLLKPHTLTFKVEGR